MIKIFKKTWIILTTLFFIYCENKNFEEPPKITFVKNDGYVFQDTTIKIGQEIKIGIYAEVMQDGNEISIIEILKNDTIYFDSTLEKQKVSLDFFMSYDIPDTIDWTFNVYDKSYNSAGVSLRTIINKLPVLYFLKDEGYVYSDTILKSGQEILVGIYAKVIGENNKLSEFIIEKNSSIQKDSLISIEEFIYNYSIIQDTIDTTIWKFYIIDETFDTASISLNTYLEEE
ncbi:MAG: hypothetical protein JXB17_10460 [Bacteroidales bacterium]|nr:hypothetical protein [Bacteroidales bacterium]